MRTRTIMVGHAFGYAIPLGPACHHTMLSGRTRICRRHPFGTCVSPCEQEPSWWDTHLAMPSLWDLCVSMETSKNGCPTNEIDDKQTFWLDTHLAMPSRCDLRVLNKNKSVCHNNHAIIIHIYFHYTTIPHIFPDTL